MVFAVAPRVVEYLREARTRRWNRCWRVGRTDGVVKRYTDHSNEIVVCTQVPSGSTAGTYETFKPVAAPSKESYRQVSGGAPETDSLFGFVFNGEFEPEEFRLGKFDDARIDVWDVESRYPWAGHFRYMAYWVKETTWSGERFEIRLASLAERGGNVLVGRIYERRCDARLGDDRCNKDISLLMSGSQTVTSVSGYDNAHPRLRFRSGLTSQPDDYWTDGQLTWLTGSNAITGSASIYQVKRSIQANGEIVLWTPTHYDIEPGDTFEVEPGCDKLAQKTCRPKFNNINNHRGFPYMRGADHVIAGPDSKQ